MSAEVTVSMSFFEKISLLIILLVSVICVGTSDPTTCNDDHFQCSGDGACIFMLRLCDKRRDCSDDSDEKSCASEDYPKCKKGYFQCENRRCIPYAWYCDGQADCDDDSDETDCAEALCKKQIEFECLRPRSCINMISRCDGKKDCADSSDERHCGTAYHKICDNLYFPCEEQNVCVPRRWLCDGTNDCRDGSDEKECAPTIYEETEESCPENYCQQNAECVSIRGQYYCNCPSSFTGEVCETRLLAEKSTNHIGVVIGVSMALVLLFIVTTLTIFYCYKRSSARRSTALMETESQMPFTSYSKE